MAAPLCPHGYLVTLAGSCPVCKASGPSRTDGGRFAPTWTPQLDAVLAELVRAHAPPREIARRLGRSPKAVARRIARLHLRRFA